MLNKFKKELPKGVRIIAHCNTCNRRSIHHVEALCTAGWDDGEGYFGGEEYRILRCGGCDSIKYSESSWTNDHYDEDEDGHPVFRRKVKMFPAPQVRKLEMDHILYVPHRLRMVLTETLDAQASNTLLLCTIGLRLSVEITCAELKIKGRDLKEKIEKLKDQGLIDEQEKEILQTVRVYGNKGAHEAEAMSAEQLASAVDVIMHVIENHYIIPERKKKIFADAATVLKPSST